VDATAIPSVVINLLNEAASGRDFHDDVLREIVETRSILDLRIVRVLITVAIAMTLAVFLPWHLNIPTPGPLVARWVVGIPSQPLDWGPNMPFMLLALLLDSSFFFLGI
jgi:hypothetical protein